ncbi:MAG: hypothetical protein U5L11_12255, partial [Arhodomonas sp.]|nr:hypothetical protein [Arhodomonas sp.]
QLDAMRGNCRRELPSHRPGTHAAATKAGPDGDSRTFTPLAPGQGTVPAGAEIPPATLLAAAGHRLSALDGARLAACGMKTATGVRAPPAWPCSAGVATGGRDVAGPLLRLRAGTTGRPGRGSSEYAHGARGGRPGAALRRLGVVPQG